MFFFAGACLSTYYTTFIIRYSSVWPAQACLVHVHIYLPLLDAHTQLLTKVYLPSYLAWLEDGGGIIVLEAWTNKADSKRQERLCC